MGERGSVLVESVLTLGLLIIPIVGFHLEMIRVAQYQAVFHFGSFYYARARALGKNEREARGAFFNFADRVVGKAEVARFHRSLDSDAEYRNGAVKGRFRFRYSGWFAYLHPRFQVTRSCRFLCSP